MSNQFIQAVNFFIYVFLELTVLFLLISFVVAVINQKLPSSKVRQLLSGNQGYGIAIALGSITPFCSCSTLPMTTGLLQARAAFGPTMAFLFTSPLLNPFIVTLFWVSFGAQVTLVYSGFVLVLAALSGYLLERFGFERFIKPDVLATTQHRANDTSKSTSINWSALAKHTLQQFTGFIPYMALGVSVGAILHGYVPENFFSSLSVLNPMWLIPLAAFIGVILYVRASTMVPIAASLAAKGLSMGTIMSLTIGGAGASLPELIMMNKLFKWPLILAFIGLVFSTACITGYTIDLL